MALWKKTAVVLFLFALSTNQAQAQHVVRVTEPTAIQPAEVAIAINPKNPDNLVGASFQTGRPPLPLAASYTYVTMDGGLTWKTGVRLGSRGTASSSTRRSKGTS